MAERGRPSIYTEELASRICERLAAGESLRSICRDDDMPDETTVRKWSLDQENPFYPQYRKARMVGYDRMSDDIIDIADDIAGDAARDRLRVDTRKWVLSKMLPKVYGDKTTTEVSGPDGAPIGVVAEIRRTVVDPKAAG